MPGSGQVFERFAGRHAVDKEVDEAVRDVGAIEPSPVALPLMHPIGSAEDD